MTLLLGRSVGAPVAGSYYRQATSISAGFRRKHHRCVCLGMNNWRGSDPRGSRPGSAPRHIRRARWIGGGTRLTPVTSSRQARAAAATVNMASALPAAYFHAHGSATNSGNVTS